MSHRWKTQFQSPFFLPWETRYHPVDLILVFLNQWSSAEMSACRLMEEQRLSAGFPSLGTSAGGSRQTVSRVTEPGLGGKI